jgi:hypothetical protein
VTWQQVVNDMKRQGLDLTGEEVPERDIEALWDGAEGAHAPLEPPRRLHAVPAAEPPTAAPVTVLALPDRIGVDVALVESDSGQLVLAI